MANTPLVILAGASLSNSVNIGSSKVVAIQMPPSVWTPAPLSFLASIDGVSFFSLFRNGNEMIDPVQAGIVAKLRASDFAGVSLIKVQSGSTTYGLVNQAAQATLVLVTQ